MTDDLLFSENPRLATSSIIEGNNDLINHLASSWIGTYVFTILRQRRHSWIWSDMWVAVICLKLVRSSVPVSYLMGNWKWVKKVVARVLKLSNEALGNSMYHFVAGLVNVRWKRRSLIESSFRVLDEHHRWKVITWFDGSSHKFPLNLGISDRSLWGIAGHQGA